MSSMTKIIIRNAEDLQTARDNCQSAMDQAAALTIGDVTWGIIYEGGQRGQMSRYTESGRGAVCYGGDSDWGDWDTRGDEAVLVLDDGTRIDEYGDELDAE